MKQRTSSLPLMVVVAVVALVIGSFGTATAAGLTKGKVKAIATKVVNKKAPTLSVAHASTAGNATLLNGQAASAYQTQAYRFRLPSAPASSTQDYSFALPNGTYRVDYAVIAGMATAGTTISCTVFTAPATASNGSEGRTYGTSYVTFSAATGGAVLRVTSGKVQMKCFGGSNFTVNSDSGTVSSLSAIRIDTLTTGNGTLSRQAPNRGDGSAG